MRAWAAAGLVLAAGLFVTAPATTPAVSAEAAVDHATVRTVSYNVCGASTCRSEKSPADWTSGLVQQIQTASGNADVVALQEVCRGQYDRLRQALPGYAGVWTSTQKTDRCDKWTEPGGDTSFGQVLLIKGHQSSVTGMSAVVTPADPVAGTAARSVVCAKAPVGGRAVLACGTHLAQDYATQSGTPVLMRSIADWADGLPVVLAGDFNATPASVLVKPVFDGLPGILNLVEAGGTAGTAWDKGANAWGPKFDLTFFSRQDFRDLTSEAVDIKLTEKDHKLLRSTAVFTERGPHVDGDLTGDRVPDLLAVQDDGSLRLYPGLGNGRFAPYQVIGASGFAGADVSHRGDWNGDGHEDVIARIGTDLWIYPNTGDGVLGERIPMGNRPVGWEHATVLAAGDVNGDGQPDVVTRSGGGVFLHRGSTGTNPGLPHGAVTLVTGTAWKDHEILTPGDVNKDGRADLWARAADGKVHQFLSAGAQALPGSSEIAVAPQAAHPLAGTVGDADRDGRADLLLTTAPQGASTGGLTFLQGDAAGTGFAPAVSIGEGGWRWIQSMR